MIVTVFSIVQWVLSGVSFMILFFPFVSPSGSEDALPGGLLLGIWISSFFPGETSEKMSSN